MPLYKCVRRCWDSQMTRRYWPGDQDNLAEDTPLVKAKCFELVTEPILPSAKDSVKAEIMAEIKAELAMKEAAAFPEEEKKRGNPNWVKKEVRP